MVQVWETEEGVSVYGHARGFLGERLGGHRDAWAVDVAEGNRAGGRESKRINEGKAGLNRI